MKFFRTLKYLLASGFRSILRAWFLNLIAVTTIATCFFIIGWCWIIFHNIRVALRNNSVPNHISVYFRQGHEEIGRKDVEKYFCNQSFIVKCQFRSALEAKNLFQKRNFDLAQALSALDENPFPSSLEIDLSPSLQNPEELLATTKKLSKLTSVEAVDNGGDWAIRWLKLLNLIDVVMVALTASLALAIIFMISNTIQLVVYAKRDEVEILSLVGATDGMIRIPFLLEGMIQGSIGVLLALFLLKAPFLLFENQLSQQWEGIFSIKLFFLSWQFQVLSLFIGILLGLVGSLMAVNRFLKP